MLLGFGLAGDLARLKDAPEPAKSALPNPQQPKPDPQKAFLELYFGEGAGSWILFFWGGM